MDRADLSLVYNVLNNLVPGQRWTDNINKNHGKSLQGTTIRRNYFV